MWHMIGVHAHTIHESGTWLVCRLMQNCLPSLFLLKGKQVNSATTQTRVCRAAVSHTQTCVCRAAVSDTKTCVCRAAVSDTKTCVCRAAVSDTQTCVCRAAVSDMAHTQTCGGITCHSLQGAPTTILWFLYCSSTWFRCKNKSKSEKINPSMQVCMWSEPACKSACEVNQHASLHVKWTSMQVCMWSEPACKSASEVNQHASLQVKWTSMQVCMWSEPACKSACEPVAVMRDKA